MAQEAAVEEIANGRLRWLSACNEFFFLDVEIGDAVLSYKAQKKKSAPRRRAPALILDIDDAGVTVKFQPQVSKVARPCARERGEGKMWRRLRWILRGFVFARVGLIWLTSWDQLMWRRIWGWTERMGILP